MHVTCIMKVDERVVIVRNIKTEFRVPMAIYLNQKRLWELEDRISKLSHAEFTEDNIKGIMAEIVVEFKILKELPANTKRWLGES